MPQQRSEISSPDTGMRAWSHGQLPYLAVTIPWLAVVYLVSLNPTMHLLTIGLGMLLLGVPMCLAGICTSALRRHRRLSALFRRQGRLYALLSGRWLRILVWTSVATVMSFVLLAQILAYGPVEWVVLVATVPFFAGIVTAIRRRLLKAGMHADVAVTEALVFSRRICPAVVLVVHVAALLWWTDFPQYTSIDNAIAAHTPGAVDTSGSALMREAQRWIGIFDGLKAYAIGHLGPADPVGVWILMGLALGNYALLYFACLAFSCFLIPRAAFVQAHLTLGSSGAVFATSAIAVFLIGFICFPLLAMLDSFVSRSPWPAHVRTTVQTVISPLVETLLVELIDGHYFEAGTRDEIARASGEVARTYAEADKQLRLKVDAAFRQLEGEPVDIYLDWYYSPIAEYGRLLALLSGTEQLKDHLERKLWETFEQEGNYAEVNDAVAGLSSAEDEAQSARQKVSDILQRNRVNSERLQHTEVDVTWEGSLEDLLDPPLRQEFVPAAHRLFGATAGAAGVAGGIGSVIAKKITAKMLAKPILKLAAKAMLKPFATKVLGIAAIGGAAGSVVPVVGTAVGAIGGLTVGTVAGVLLDGASLKVEEALRRDKHRREIVLVVREAHREFVDQYLGSPSPPEPNPG